MRITKRDAVWGSLLALVFFLAGHYIFGRDSAKVVVDAMVIGLAIAICITWWRAAMGAIGRGLQDGADNLLATVWGTWTIILLYFLWVLAFQIAGRPDSWRLSPLPGTFSVLFDIMGIFALLTPLNTDAKLPRPRMTEWWIGVGVGAFAAGVLCTLAFLQIFRVG